MYCIGTNSNQYFFTVLTWFIYEKNIEYFKKMFKGKLLNQDKKNGILLSNQTLVLQHVLKPRSGLYTCSAENTEGTGESNPLPLEVKFSPECSPNQIQVILRKVLFLQKWRHGKFLRNKQVQIFLMDKS